MASNMYLNCESIKGESTDKNHKDWIEVLSFSHGLSQPISGASATGGSRAARADFAPFVVTKYVDKASIDLNLSCAKGTHIDKVVLEICQETDEQICYLKYELENVMIQSVLIDGASSERPHETVAFVYAKISWTYTMVNTDGSVGSIIGPKKWNLETNAAK